MNRVLAYSWLRSHSSPEPSLRSASAARWGTAVVGSNHGHAMFVSRGWVEWYGRASNRRQDINETYASM